MTPVQIRKLRLKAKARRVAEAEKEVLAAAAKEQATKRPARKQAKKAVKA